MNPLQRSTTLAAVILGALAGPAAAAYAPKLDIGDDGLRALRRGRFRK